MVGHPLNDVHPLGHNMVGTRKQVLFVSDKITIIILFDKGTKKLEFSLLKRSYQGDQTDEDYLKQIMPQSRHSVLDLPASEP